MGKTATTLGVVLVLVLLGVVVLVVFAGGNGSLQASAKPTETASVDTGKKTAPTPIDARSRIKSSSRIQAPSTKTALGQGDKKMPPSSPALGAAAPSDRASKTEPLPAPGGTATAPAASPLPGDAATTTPALAAGNPPPPAGTGDANDRTTIPSATTPLLDFEAYLSGNEKKDASPTEPDAAAVTPKPGDGGSATGAAKTGGADGALSGAAPVAGTADAALAKAEYTTYVTQKDDTLWVLAVRFFQDGTKWQDILKANPGLPPDGRLLPEGYHLRIPPAPPPAPVTALVPPPANTEAYTIKAGDKLWNLALTFYGDGTLYKEILAANPGLDGARLSVGKVIYLPVIPGKGPKGSSPEAPPPKN